MTTTNMPVEWTAMTGLYAHEQYPHILEGAATLFRARNNDKLRQPVHVPELIIYTRPAMVPLLGQLCADLNQLAKDAKARVPLMLMGGISLHGGTPDAIYDYVMDRYLRKTSGTDFVVPKYSAQDLYSPQRWNRIAQLVDDVAKQTGRSAVAVVSEPDPVQLRMTGYSPTKIATCWARVAKKGCPLWVDQPTLTNTNGPLLYDPYAELVAVKGFTKPNAWTNSPVQFMPLEPPSGGYYPLSTDWRHHVADRWSYSITAGKNVHFRFAVAAKAETEGSWRWDVDSFARAWPQFAGRWSYGAPVLYVKHEDWVTVCQQIAERTEKGGA